MNTSNGFSKSIGRFLVKYRFLLLLLVVVLTAFFGYSSRCLKFDGSVDVWFTEGDPAAERKAAFKASFGNQHSVLVLVEPSHGVDLFSPENIGAIRGLVSEFERSVPYLKEVQWVGSMDIVVPDGTGIRIDRLFEHEAPFTAQEAEEGRRRAMAEDDFIQRYISKDGRALAIILDFLDYPGDAKTPEKSIAQSVYAIVGAAGASLPGVSFSVVGEPVFQYNYEVIAAKQTPMMFGLCMLMQLFLFVVMMRSFAASFTPLFIVFLSVIWTFGFIGLAGFDLNLMIIGLPIILVCVCTGNAVHLISDFTEIYRTGVPRKEALAEAVAAVGWPCLLTSLTTAAGFVSFAAAPMRPFQQMALYASLGVLAALVLTFVLIPFFYSFGRRHYSGRVRTAQPAHLSDRFLDRKLLALANGVVRHPAAVVAAFGVLTAVFGASIWLVQIESNNNKLLLEKVPMRQAIDHVDATMGGSMAIDVMLDTGRENGIKSAKFLKDMQNLESCIASHPLVVSTMSVLEPLRKTRQAIYGGDPKMRTVPESDGAAAEYLFLYEMAGGNQLDKLVSFDSSKVRINARTTSLGTAEGRRLSEDIQKAAKKFIEPGVKVMTGGSIDLTTALTDNVARGQNSSILLALCTICAIMMIATRSVPMGLISMVPNVIPVIMVLGLLGLTGVYMDTILMTVSSMIFGVATDDTIHFYIRLKKEFDAIGKYREAVIATVADIGRPLFYTTVILCCGFLVMTVSVMVGWIKIGLLASYAFAWALLADLTLSPALILLFKPFGRERG
ncbi:MAG: MMPL family transporter [Desulfovibrio sp.]|nr:MMPL family transporter [Desulfovibrio sp.]